jgi:hypothetical protein
MVCPNENSEKPFLRKIFIGAEKENFSLSIEDWKDLVKPYDECNHPLDGKIVRAAIMGTIPYLYTDDDNIAVCNEQGIPLGSNGRILQAISQVLGFNLNIKIFESNVIWDNKTGKFTNFPGQVMKNELNSETQQKF